MKDFGAFSNGLTGVLNDGVGIFFDGVSEDGFVDGGS
jgi:hypothetical protein